MMFDVPVTRRDGEVHITANKNRVWMKLCADMTDYTTIIMTIGMAEVMALAIRNRMTVHISAPGRASTVGEDEYCYMEYDVWQESNDMTTIGTTCFDFTVNYTTACRIADRLDECVDVARRFRPLTEVESLATEPEETLSTMTGRTRE